MLQSRPLLFIAILNMQITVDGVSSRTHKNLFRFRIKRRLTLSSTAAAALVEFSYRRNHHLTAIGCGRSLRSISGHRSTIVGTQRHASRR